ncbi:hypothetical protein [Actinokineospora sp.]|uniref:hypothetical protein n=1 Tax=Actinokineospora sp. TaxID=1872133 RepID=UPI0040379555
MSHQPISEADACGRFAELAELVAIREAGWSFHLLRDNDDVIGIAASYSREQYTDAVFVFDRRHVLAARLVADEYGGGMVWFRDGADLVEVVRELVGLPAPGEPGAPSLVIRASSLWTP